MRYEFEELWMESLEQEFGFESSVVPLDRHTFFRPLRDAAQRWVTYRPEPYELGTRFEILYALKDGRFVLVRYGCCERTIEEDGRNVWRSSYPPTAGEVQEVYAIHFLMKHQIDIPESLEPLLERMDVPPPPRAPEYWLAREQQTFRYGVLAHQARPMRLARWIHQLAVTRVQKIREYQLNLDPEIPEKDEVLGGWGEFMQLFTERYKMAADTWWGSPNEIPPASVGLFELKWPSQTEPIRQVLRELFDLVAAPATTVAVSHRLMADRPTGEELSRAKEALIEALPRVEELTLRLGRELASYTQRVKAAANDKKGARKLKSPTAEAFRVWFLHATTGKTQVEVAELYQQLDGNPMTQGQVSRMLQQVNTWLEQGNELPSNVAFPMRKPRPVDPSVIDMGAHQEGRTPRQRRKPSRRRDA
jgi:hypothetical protein